MIKRRQELAEIVRNDRNYQHEDEGLVDEL